jgi:ribosomal protein S18 acetylase RimI-like enzyme
MASVQDPLVIRPPQADERSAAMKLALAALPGELRQNVMADREGKSRVFGAWRGERLVGAIWGELQPGRAGFVHLPIRLESEPLDTASALVAAWENWLTAQGGRFFQLQLEETSASDEAVLAAAGVAHAGDLLFLAADVQSASYPPGDLEFESYRESQRIRLAALTAQTYEGSLDLPILDDIRTPEEVLEGYRHNGAFRPDAWRFVRRAGEDIGCLFLTEHPHRQWELVYMGLVPNARGGGFGKSITTYAQSLVRDLGGVKLLLAVDEANAPALVAYRRTGFLPWRRSSVFLKVLCPAKRDPARL